MAHSAAHRAPHALSPVWRPFLSKRDALVWLLEHRGELDQPDVSGGQGDGDGVPIPLHDRACRIHRTGRTCSCWRRSLPLLDLALAELRRELPVHCAHLLARHGEAVRVQRPGLRIRNGAWTIAPNERVVIPDLDLKAWRGHTGSYDAVVVRWRPWVDLLIVAEALDRLEQLYRGEVRLPSEAVAA